MAKDDHLNDRHVLVSRGMKNHFGRGIGGTSFLPPWMWVCYSLTIICLIFLVIPKCRNNLTFLPFLCIGVIVAIWIEKGVAMVVTAFIPSPLGKVTEYTPTAHEIAITLGVYAVGFLLLTVLYKIVLTVRERLQVT